uniref:Retrotransposon gag domain-containing protein n=1 Tax=Hucho hucho TaxID=62062 RepID=A0A4W5PHU8_9TELE
MDRVVQMMDRWERQGVPPAPPPAQPGSPLLVPPSSGPSGIRLALPREYDGTVARCQGFLLQLELYLATVHPAPSGREKVSALVSCLSGKALEWANAEWEEGDAALDHFEEFTRCFRAVFDHPPEGRAAGERLFHLRQGMRSAQEFVMDFRTLAAGAGWNDRALIDHYRCSLREDVCQELAFRDTTLTFDQLVDLSIRLYNLLATCRLSEGGLSVPSPGLSVPSPSTTALMPMELGGAALRETGGGSGLCTICGRRGHTARRGRVGASGSRGSRQGTLALPQVSRHHAHPEPSVAHMFLYVAFPEFSPHSQHKALVDSGAAGNFIDRSFAHSLGIPIVPVVMPFPVHALDSRPLGLGLISLLWAW